MTEAFVYKFSDDGGGTWSETSERVFPYGACGTEDCRAAGTIGAVWYSSEDPDNGRVYVIVGNKCGNDKTGDGCSGNNSRYAFVQAGKPMADGTIEWKTTPATVKMGHTSTRYMYENGSVNISKLPNQLKTDNNIRLMVVIKKSSGGDTHHYVRESGGSVNPVTMAMSFNETRNTNMLTVTGSGVIDHGLLLVPHDTDSFYGFYKIGSESASSQKGVMNFIYKDTLESNTNATSARTTRFLTASPNLSIDYSHSAVVEPAEGSQYTIHYVGIGGDNDGVEPVYVRYRRRAAGGGSGWSGPVTIDSVHINARNPTIAWVDGDPDDAIYVVYTDSCTDESQNPYYSLWMSSASSVDYDTWFPPVKIATGTIDLYYDNPSLDMYGASPWFLPLTYTGSDGNVYFDGIVTSPFPPPNLSGITISSDPATAPFSAKQYTLIIENGSDFLKYAGAGPKLAILKGGAAQNEIKVIQSYYHSPSSFTALVSISSTVVGGISGGPYDLKITNPEGQTDTTQEAIGIPAPQITSVSEAAYETDAGSPNSGGILPNNSGTTFITRDLRILGSNFMDWGASTGMVTVLITGGITVDTVTYNGTGDFIAKLKISSATAGGEYQVTVKNPEGQNFETAAATFTVTVPTATISYPAEGDGFASYYTEGVLMKYSTGFAIISGGAGFNDLGQTSLEANQNIRITGLTSNAAGDTVITGQTWTGAVWSSPSNPELAWKDAAGTDLWNYASFIPDNQCLNGTEGQRYRLEARARTLDEGRGNPSAAVEVTLDRRAPEGAITSPGSAAIKAQLPIIFEFTETNEGAPGLFGIGVSTCRILIMDTRNTSDPGDDYSWTGSSWSDIEGAEIWLTTDTTDASDMYWSGSTPADSFKSTATVTLDDGTKIPSPEWLQDKKYKIQICADDGFAGIDPANHSGCTDPQQFIFDVVIPTLTLNSPAPLSDSGVFEDMPWYIDVTEIGGQMEDLGDTLNDYFIYVRIYDMGIEGGGPFFYLNPATDVFDGTPKGSAWKEVKVQGSASAIRGWTRGTSLVPWDDNHGYKIEVYAKDSAGNSTGTATFPLFTKYFRLEDEDPTITISYPEPGNYGGTFAGTVDGTAGDEVSGVSTVTYSLRYNGSGGTFHWDPDDYDNDNAGAPDWDNQSDIIWNVGWSTDVFKVSPATWTVSGVNWINGKNYYLSIGAKDFAGNVTVSSSTLSFRFDVSSPVTNVSFPKAETYSETFSDISGTSVDGPGGGYMDPAGIKEIFGGIRRESDGLWWNGSTWTARGDFLLGTESPWSITGLKGLDNFWDLLGDAGITAETFDIHVWAKDNITKPAADDAYRNIESSVPVKLVFKYEIEPPSSTIIVPSNPGGIYEWYYSDTVDFPAIEATAVDLPQSGPGSGGAVDDNNVWVQIWDDNNLCWNGTDFAATCQPFSYPAHSSWKNMPLVSSSHTFSTSLFWSKAVDGKTYKIRVSAWDLSKSQTGDAAPNREGSFDPGRNEKYFRVDKSKPEARIIAPVNGSELNSYPSAISGTAADVSPGSGLLEVSTAVMRVAYYEEGNCSGGTGAFWDIDTGNFEIAGTTDNPPTEAWGPPSTV
ncbi:MAG: hypothetical protein ABIG11_09990, partial [bacterium]